MRGSAKISQQWDLTVSEHTVVKTGSAGCICVCLSVCFQSSSATLKKWYIIFAVGFSIVTTAKEVMFSLTLVCLIAGQLVGRETDFGKKEQ